MDLNTLLTHGVKIVASDLHLSPNQPPIFRTNGDLIREQQFPEFSPDMIVNCINPLLDDMQKENLRNGYELDFSLILPEIGIFRINVFRQLRGISAVFRIIPSRIPTLEELNAPPLFKELLKLNSGLIIVAGPTGCGKSTTLASLIECINLTQQCHIITVEDPIEYIYETKNSLIHQRQVTRDTISFASALRSALREDPDVILIGEMRDLETIRLALTAAETGHLIFATLHTSSAPRAVNRIIEAFPSGEKNMIRNIISESIQAVICQALIKKISGGLIPAYEIMLGTPAIRNLIREDKTAQMYSVIQTNQAVGMCTMEQYLKELINKKLIESTVAAASNNIPYDFFAKLTTTLNQNLT